MRGRQPVQGTGFAVVHEPAAGSRLVLELHGPARTGAAEILAARLAERHREYAVTLDGRGDGRHVLRLTRTAAAPGPAVLGPELLADVLGAPGPAGEPVPVTGHRRELLLGSAAPGGERGVEQLHWNWTGPLESARFSDAWQSVAERESILRASFDWAALPRIVLHPRAEITVERHPRASVAWDTLLERDRRRGFDVSLPGLLRLTLLDGPAAPDGAPTTRVLLAYHRALLDERGVHLLLWAFYRAYASGGVLPGAERRPDIRDHARWLAGQPTDAAREFWSQNAPPRHAAVSPGRPAGPTRRTGFGRVRRRLPAVQAHRLRTWAAARGAGESSALHVAWALLLYRAAQAEGPLPVSFGVRLTGRDLALAGAAGMPGLLGTTVPMTVTVDCGMPLAELVRTARDTLLDVASYPWADGDRVRAWSGRGAPGQRSPDTAVLFDSRPDLPEAVRRELRDQGVEVEAPRGVTGGTTLPLTLVARHDADGALVLTGVYERASLTDADAAELLSQCVRLLRGLPRCWEPAATVREALDLLSAAAVPGAARRPPPARPVLTTLRPGRRDAAVLCLVSVPGVPPGCYDRLLGGYGGPEPVVGLQLAGPPQALPAALEELLGAGRRLVLCGYGPGAWAAYELARAAAARGVPATVVMADRAGAAAGAGALVSALGFLERDGSGS
jgi:hypothetical protein